MNASTARLVEAQGVAQQQGALLYPQLSANASVDHMKQSYNNGLPPEYVPKNYNNQARATLDFSYKIDFWGKNRAALAAATSEFDAAQADAAQARITLAASIAAAYAELDQLYKQRGTVKQMAARRAMAEADLKASDELIALQRNKLAALLAGSGAAAG